MPALHTLVTTLDNAKISASASRQRATETAAMFYDTFTSLLAGPPGFLGFWPPDALFNPTKDEAVAQYREPLKSVLYDKTRQAWLLGFSLLLTREPFVAMRFTVEFKEDFVHGDPGQRRMSNGFSWALLMKGKHVLKYPSDDYEIGIKNFAFRILEFLEKELQQPDFWMNPPPPGGIFIE